MNQIALVVILAGGLSGRPVDLSGWMSMALAGSGEIIQADAGLEQADAAYSIARSSLLPRLVFSASAGHSWSSMEVEPAGHVDTESDHYTAGLTLSQEILGSGGSSWLSLRSASLGREKSDLQRRAAVLSLERSVAAAYYGAVGAVELVAASEAALERSNALLDRMEMLYELGAARELELLEARMRESADRLALLRNEQALTQSITELRRTAGVSGDTTMTVDTSAVLSPLTREAILALPTDYSENPSLRAADLALEESTLDLRAARRSYWPSLVASASWSWSDDEFEPEDAHLNDTWNVGVSLTWSIFDGWLREGRIQSAGAGRLAAEAVAGSAEGDIEAAVRAAWDELLASSDNLALAGMTLEYATRRMELSQLSYELGDLAVTDLLDAQADLSKAEADLVSARTACLVAEAGYWVLLGRSPRLGE
ncbi:MAG TPA: TolC family protein [Candidatus Fermentibacter daniensis]|nr:TolC family protein [Candidatus Fermentibacter daniensis]